MEDGRQDGSDIGRVQPCIAEIFRTCVLPQSLVLRVRRVIVQDLSDGVGKDAHVEGVVGTGPHPQPQPQSQAQHVVKLILTDDRLNVQALLHRRIGESKDISRVKSGDLVSIHSFKVKRAPRVKGVGDVVYFGIHDCDFLSSSEDHDQNPDDDDSVETSPKRGHKRHSTLDAAGAEAADDSESLAGSFIRKNTGDPESSWPKRPRLSIEREIEGADQFQTDPVHFPHSPSKQRAQFQASSSIRSGKQVQVARHSSLQNGDYDSASDAEDVFETWTPDVNSVHKRRHALRQFDDYLPSSDVGGHWDFPTTPTSCQVKTALSRNLHVQQSIANDKSIENFPEKVAEETTPNQASQHRYDTEDKNLPIQPKPVTDLQQPDGGSRPLQAPFHTLQSIVQPPPSRPLPKKNYAFSTLAVVTWVGSNLISKPNSPFPPKRNIKIEDPSLYGNPASVPSDRPGSSGGYKGITVAVYRDAAIFKPAIGTIAFFRELIMHRLSNGDVMLNVYTHSRGAEASDKHKTSDDFVAPDGLANVNDDWIVTDLARLEQDGFDIKTIQEWWIRRNKITNNPGRITN